MTVRHPADLTALSNMMNYGTDLKENGWAVTTYEESPPMVLCLGYCSDNTTKQGVLLSLPISSLFALVISPLLLLYLKLACWQEHIRGRVWKSTWITLSRWFCEKN